MKPKFFQNNRDKFFQNIKANSLSLLYSGRLFQKTNDQEYPFEVEKNFYYLCGINQANVILALIKLNDYNKSVLFVEENDPVLSKWIGEKLTKEKAKIISGVDEVRYLTSFDDFIFSLFNSTRVNTNRVSSLYLNLERRNIIGYTNWALEFSNRFCEDYPEIEILNMREVVLSLRMIKEEDEILAIEKAILVTKKGIEEILINLKPGLNEYHVDALFDYSVKTQGNYTLAFETIAATGKNATILHYSDKTELIQKEDLVLLDLGARNGLYVSDISRTIPASGKFNKRQKEVYSVVLEVNKKCIEYIKVGLTWAEFNNYSRLLLYKGLKNLGLVKSEEEVNKYYYHSIGHYIGLDTHDPGLAEVAFQEGMVLTVEPGVYIEEENIGVRIEDNILVTKHGPKNLSKEIIKEISEIEEFMKAV